MSDCCGGSKDKAQKVLSKQPCPKSGKNSLSVPFATILHHLKAPWTMPSAQQAAAENWYFCDDPDCDIVYFTPEGRQIDKVDLRTKIAVKGDADGLVCFCYGVDASQAANPAIKAFVMTQTKAKNCACDSRNPSGRCCLKNFPK